MTTDYWVKACPCESRSTSGQVRSVPVQMQDGQTYMAFRWTFYPQPSCDACGTPWVRGVEA